MSNYVLKYSRSDAVKYISHLDFVRMFHRAVRRSGLPMSYSQGFNPHPIMTVAMPLSVGVTADGELLKIGFDAELTPDEIKTALNKALPVGFSIVAAQKADEKHPDFAELDRAVYTVDIETEASFLINAEAFLANPELKVMKKSKSGIKEADIRPHIHSFEVLETGSTLHQLKLCVSAGNLYNLKPETVVDALKLYTDGFSPVFLSVHRNCMLAGTKEFLKN